MSEGKLPGDDDEWIISISGYGEFLFRGNEDDARFMCDGKARWEGGVGVMWRASDPTFGLDAERRNVAFNRRVRERCTRAAQDAAAKYPQGVATWKNYGRSDASPAAPLPSPPEVKP